ncbi:MAG TPA: methyltransferase [Caulobacteraceae bacterium]|jgi:predicted methyltransferase|nr:methyltransferase [Caulobacteraceae bacterium]
MKPAVAVAAIISVAAFTAAAAPAGPIAKAMAEPLRTEQDRALDQDRKPAEILSAIHLKPGERIVDVWPGKYWDMLFSGVVGPKGEVIAWMPDEAAKAEHVAWPAKGTKLGPNVVAQGGPVNEFTVAQPVDVVWIRQNYHDFYDKFMGPADVPGFDRAVFKALKKGGLFVVIDHAAPAGSDLADTDTTHRIDEARVKRDMKAAGFSLAGSSDALRNPADPHTANVFDKAIRGHTDQFVLIFRKP